MAFASQVFPCRRWWRQSARPSPQSRPFLLAAMAENGEGAAAAAAARSTPLESGHADMVHDCQLDYYGTRLATCSSDRLVKVFQVSGTPQAPTHQHLADLAGHEHPVWRVAWAHPKVRTPGGTESTQGAQSAQIGGMSPDDATRRGTRGATIWRRADGLPVGVRACWGAARAARRRARRRSARGSPWVLIGATWGGRRASCSAGGAHAHSACPCPPLKLGLCAPPACASCAPPGVF